MEKYDVFTSEGGYRVAIGIYLDSPVMDTCPWFKDHETAEKYSALAKKYDDLNAKIIDRIEKSLDPDDTDVEMWNKEMKAALDMMASLKAANVI